MTNAEEKKIEEYSATEMVAKVKYKEGSSYNVNGEDVGVFHNLTEVHYNYKSLTGERDSTAFESDIEGDGATIKNKEIEEIEITLVTKATPPHDEIKREAEKELLRDMRIKMFDWHGTGRAMVDDYITQQSLDKGEE